MLKAVVKLPNWINTKSPGVSWPTSGRLGSLIVQSLRQNAGAALEVSSSPDSGLRVVIHFARADAAPVVS